MQEENKKQKKHHLFGFLKKKNKNEESSSKIEAKEKKKKKKDQTKRHSVAIEIAKEKPKEPEKVTRQSIAGSSAAASMQRLREKMPNWQEQTRKVMKEAKFETFPIAGDLPRLLTHLSIVKDTGDGEFETIFPYNENMEKKTNTAGDCFQVIKCITQIMEGKQQAANIEQQWKELIVDDEDMSVQKTFLTQILKKVFIDEGEFKEQSPTLTFLKAVNQKIIANATMNLKIVCGDLFFKDSYPMFWEIACILQSRTYLIHYRKQEAASKKKEEYFRFLWELRLVFTKDMLNLDEITMGISTIEFNPETTQGVRDKVLTTLKSLMFADCRIKNVGDEEDD